MASQARYPIPFDPAVRFTNDVPESIMIIGPPRSGMTSLFRNYVTANLYWGDHNEHDDEKEIGMMNSSGGHITRRRRYIDTD